jgi:uncharacterized protein (DUF2267 family)
MTEIIKTKFLCKTDCSLIDTNQTPLFIKGKWYDGEYETWSFSEGYEINGGWRNYFVVNENGVKQRLSRARFRAIFETCNQHLRDKKIEDILSISKK